MRLDERVQIGLSPGAAATRPTAGPIRVLVVDDEPNVRLVFRTALESEGYRVDEAADGEAALGQLKRSPCDVVLLDLQMPGLGGMEVLRRLRDEGNGVSVVIITAHGTIPDAVAAMKLGAIDFLAKPLTPDALRRMVAQVLAREDVRDGTETPPQAESRPRSLLTSAKRALRHRLFHRARGLLREAIKEEPLSPEPHYLLGVLSEVEGKPKAAANAYQAALRVAPGYEPARLQLMKQRDAR